MAERKQDVQAFWAASASFLLSGLPRHPHIYELRCIIDASFAAVVRRPDADALAYLDAQLSGMRCRDGYETYALVVALPFDFSARCLSPERCSRRHLGGNRVSVNAG